MPLEALLIPVNPTNSDYDGINGGTGCNFIFFTVPTTCSRPSIEMVGFIIIIIIIMFSPCSLSWPHCYILLCRLLVVGPVLKWLALLLCRLLVVGPVLKWLALFITVPTTCSRPSIEMVGFIYLFIYLFLRVHSPDQTVIYY